ncbi:hypothetical protein llap_5210 [Limosa lapponica baueri]|uniref:Uncharacterized protein n=1 Tax=Limosa lapponica baueri TaxID=1758121 RepID=A0A2I0UEK2_LIMLA|nr:hypothetical protein llap_5210 [Limosa lapponica baueri]
MVEGLDGIPVHKSEDGRDYTTSPDDTVNLFKVEVSNNVLYSTFPYLAEVSTSLITSRSPNSRGVDKKDWHNILVLVHNDVYVHSD